MKAWLATMMLGASSSPVSEGGMYFTAERGEAQRERDRQLWWKFKLKADASNGNSDNLIART